MKRINKTLLIVDDEPLIRATLREELPYLGLVVHEASNGEEAVHILQQERIDMVITDIKMPVKDGFYVLNYIAENKLEHIVTFVCSGYHQEENEKIADYSISEVVKKPFDLVEFLDLIKKYL